VYRFLLSSRWLRMLAGAILASTACVFLGIWQLHRFEHKHAGNDLITHNLAVAPVPPSRLLHVGHGLDPADQWRRVRVTGRYDAAHQLLVRNRPVDGEYGYLVLTPLVQERGPALLVDRGFVPAGQTAARPDRMPVAPTGPVTVVARLRVSEAPAGGAAPPRGQVTRIDVPAIAETLPYPTYGGFAELVHQSPAPPRALISIRAPQLSDGPHLAYMVQWWLFAFAPPVGFVVLARREAADRRIRDRLPSQVPASRSAAL
jgi:cytochrome oxidase assembly protein ShyY1